MRIKISFEKVIEWCVYALALGGILSFLMGNITNGLLCVILVYIRYIEIIYLEEKGK